MTQEPVTPEMLRAAFPTRDDLVAARAEAEAQLATVVEAFGRDNPWERIPAEGLVTTVYDPWECYACSSSVEKEGYDQPDATEGNHDAHCGWFILANLPQSARDHDARIARPWREAVKEAVERHSLHSGLCSCIDPFIALLATESTQQAATVQSATDEGGFGVVLWSHPLPGGETA